AAECFEKRLELAPDQQESYEELFRYLRREGKPGKAEAVGRRLLERFPDHVTALEQLGDLLLEEKRPAEGLGLLRRALRGNPLDRSLRARVVEAHLACARGAALDGRFDEARPHYQAALDLRGGRDDAPIYSGGAAWGSGAGEGAGAGNLLPRARAGPASPLPVSFGMLTEAARLKLSRDLKTRFDREVADGLAAPPDPAALAFTTVL